MLLAILHTLLQALLYTPLYTPLRTLTLEVDTHAFAAHDPNPCLPKCNDPAV